MGPEDYNVSGVYLRGYLAGLRKLTGHQYPRLLAQAGLSQYLQKYPPADLSIVAKGRQLIALNKAVNQAISDDLFDLFSRNLGREFGRATASNPVYQATAQAAGPVTDQASLRRLMEKVIPLNLGTMNEQVSLAQPSDTDGLLLIYEGCIYCSHRSKTEKPACHGVGAYYKELLLVLTGQRFQVEEITCGATSDSHDCHFLMRRA
jgi:predicted hydrocarbon binding protein